MTAPNIEDGDTSLRAAGDSMPDIDHKGMRPEPCTALGAAEAWGLSGFIAR